MVSMFRLNLQLILAVYLLGASSAASVLLPWHVSEAQRRQVIRVWSDTPRHNPLAVFTLAAEEGERLRLIAADKPAACLPIYIERGGKVSATVPGQVSPGKSVLLVAYFSRETSFPASPVLQSPPTDTDDFATATTGDAWDFEEGDQEGITSWGNRPTEYGKVEVRDGKLIVPVTGNDPYFIWGVMWGDPADSRALHLDSKLYRTLRLRVRQSCRSAIWSLYLTDRSGKFESMNFEVRGTEWQELAFDLAEVFEGFWDGREFRALRIDPTNNSPGAVVEIDWVRLLPAPLLTEIAPVLSREQVLAREKVTSVEVTLPYLVEAGAEMVVNATCRNRTGQPVAGVPVAIDVHSGTNYVLTRAATADARGKASFRFVAGTKSGTYSLTVGVADDLGHAAKPARKATIIIKPASLDHYEIVPERRLILTSQPQIKLTLYGADRFGNRTPVPLSRVKWRTTGGAIVQPVKARPEGAVYSLTCSRAPLTKHTITAYDSAGHTGSTEVTTMAWKSHPLILNSCGYFISAEGTLFLPLGGFYANWPAALPDAEGKMERAIDLFPCGASAYPHGFPWRAEVEKKVKDYLEHCHRHGVTALRLMLRNMDLIGRVDREQLQAILHLLDMAKPLGIRFNLVLFEDYDKPPYCNREVLEKVVLPHYTEDELKHLPAHRARFLNERRLLHRSSLKYTDPDAIACQKDYLAELLPYLTEREEVFCYELENEMVYPPLNWVNEMTAFIHEIDPRTPVLGNPGPHNWPEPLRWRESTCDLFSFHPYNDGLPFADHGAVVFMLSKWAAVAGKPMFTGEGGINQNRWQREVKKVPTPFAVRGIRDQIWLSLCCGANGAFMWTASHEGEVAEFGKVHDALNALDLNLAEMRRRRPQVAIVMPVADSSANEKAFALAWKLLSMGVDFDIVPSGKTGGYTTLIEAATTSPEQVNVTPELFKPADGYQLAYLASEQLDQVLVYLRNSAGGIVNMGNGRPCYVRQPATAEATIQLVEAGRWRRVRAYDLDEGKLVELPPLGSARAVSIRKATEHDFVVSLQR